MSINLAQDILPFSHVPASYTLSPFNVIPLELVTKIFSHLSCQDLQNVSRTSRTNHFCAVSVANYRQPLEVKAFIAALRKNLITMEFPEMMQELADLQASICTQDFTHLNGVKRHILSLQSSIVCILKTLDLQIIDHLRESVPTPAFFDDVYLLIQLEKQVDQAFSEDNALLQSKMFLQLSKIFIDKKYAKRAHEIAVLCSLPSDRDSALGPIATYWTQNGNIELSLEISHQIEDRTAKDKVLLLTAQALVAACDLDRAKEISSLIFSEYTRGEALFQILDLLIKKDETQTAFKVAEGILSPYWKSSALALMTEKLTQNAAPEFALRTATEIPIDNIRSQAFAWVCNAFVAKADFASAHRLQAQITTEQHQASTLNTIAQGYFENNEFDQAIMTAFSIQPIDEQAKALDALAERFFDKQDFQTAIRIVLLNPLDDHKYCKLYSFSLRLIEKNLLKESLDLALKISWQHKRNDILKRISGVYFHQKNFEKAVSVALAISSPQLQEQTLWSMFETILKCGDIPLSLETMKRFSSEYKKDLGAARIARYWFREGPMLRLKQKKK